MTTIKPGGSSRIIKPKTPRNASIFLFTKDVARKQRPMSLREVSAVCDENLKSHLTLTVDKTQGDETTIQKNTQSNSDAGSPTKTTMKTRIASVKTSIRNAFTSRKEVSCQQQTTIKMPVSQCDDELLRGKKTIKDLNVLKMLDKHYEIRPGIHKIPYKPWEVRVIVEAAGEIFKNESALLEIQAPVVICGDIHGQYNDLINMFLMIGRPPFEKYLFLGDYVDRGQMSLECIILLMLYKIQYPNSIFLLRGNHECSRVNCKYGFLDELLTNFDANVGRSLWECFQRSFNNMSISALINGKIFCMHGGLSPVLDTLDDIRKERKPLRNPFKGVVNDMLWADPDAGINFWRASARGSGFVFGEQIVQETCRKLGIELITRAHQLCVDGFWMFAQRRLVTIFSAPAYCNVFRNAGSALKVDKNLICQFICFVPNSPNVFRMIVQKNQLWEKEVETKNSGIPGAGCSSDSSNTTSDKPLPHPC